MKFEEQSKFDVEDISLTCLTHSYIFKLKNWILITVVLKDVYVAFFQQNILEIFQNFASNIQRII